MDLSIKANGKRLEMIDCDTEPPTWHTSNVFQFADSSGFEFVICGVELFLEIAERAGLTITQRPG